jgi:ABC-type branched-subunit amino acid transport system substrate-binding protein
MSNGNIQNPYTIGTPIDKPTKFFGRESLFDFIEDNLNQQAKVILLQGQRRIGKSSILRMIPHFITEEEYTFVQFDLQHRSDSSLVEILYNLAGEIISQLDISENVLKPPSRVQLEDDINVFSRRFLLNLYQLISPKNLVLLLDEFDVLNQDHPDNSNFFEFIQQIIKQHNQLFIIPVIGRYLADLPKLKKLFKDAPFQEIGLLDENSTQTLIEKPVASLLTYQPEAVQKILQLSAGHPFFTQATCSTLFAQAREEQRWNVTAADVEHIASKAIVKAEAGLVGFWDVLTVSERVIISSVAEAQNISEEPFALLKKNGVIPTESLVEAGERLIKNGYLYNDSGYKIRVELIRRWVVKNHPLRREILELEKVELQLVESLQILASRACQQGKHQEALHDYERALEINPNHFTIASRLAKEYLQANNFEKALELYRQVYQAQPERYKEDYLNALQSYGHHLIMQKKWAKAKVQYQNILAIEPNRQSAIERLKEINNSESGNPITIKFRNSRQFWRLPFPGWITSNIISTLAVIGAFAFGTHQIFTPCLPGEQKHIGLICLKDTSKISRGERTLFSNIDNTSRDLGIQALVAGEYEKATEFFKQAVAAKRNDPEVLIYYNNSLARQKGTPFTLAAVVPVSNTPDVAQEILRGVAQAQKQFNQKGGLNGRLLEIVIANDAGKPEQARQVAAELLKDTSVLGVIGHYSSDTTKTALTEYNKKEIPVITPASTSIFLQGNNFFRSIPSDKAAGEKLAEYAFNTLNIKSVVIFSNPDSSYSDSMREVFTNKFEKLGGSVVRKPLINLTDKDIDAEKEVPKSVFRYKAEAGVLFPDALSTNAALKIVKANQDLLKRSKRGLKLLGGDTLYSKEALGAGKDAVNNLTLIVPWFREASQARRFAKKAKDQWGGDVSWRTATSYDATQAFIQAFSPNSNPATIIERLKNVNISAENTSGDSLKFTPERERQTEPFIISIEKGKFVK